MMKKYDMFMDLMNAAEPLEIKYLIKILLGTLRIGVNENSLIRALLDLKSSYMEDEESYDQFLFEVEQEVFGHNIRDRPSKICVGTPVNCMLGRSAKNFKELHNLIMNNKKIKQKKVIVEVKYDGERTQIHYKDKKVDMFSRGFEVQNYKYLDLHEEIEKYFANNLTHVEDCILDGEVIYKDNDGQILKFNEMKKKYKYRREVSDRYPCLYLFDIMLYNNRTLINSNILERKKILAENFFGHKKHKDFKYMCCTKPTVVDMDRQIAPELEITELMQDSLDSN
jgi:DNA ligase 1